MNENENINNNTTDDVCDSIPEDAKDVNLNEEKFDRNLDIVVIARNSAKDRSYQEIESAFMNLAQKHAIAGGTDEETSY